MNRRTGYTLTFDVMERMDGSDRPITSYSSLRVQKTVQVRCTFQPTPDEALALVEDVITLNSFNKNRLRRGEFTTGNFTFYEKDSEA